LRLQCDLEDVQRRLHGPVGHDADHAIRIRNGVSMRERSPFSWATSIAFRSRGAGMKGCHCA
jgi:hypothetical protein